MAARLSLMHGRAIDGIVISGDIIDLDGDDVAPAKLAVDCKIEQRAFQGLRLIWNLVRTAQRVLGMSGGRAPAEIKVKSQSRRLGLQRDKTSVWDVA